MIFVFTISFPTGSPNLRKIVETLGKITGLKISAEPLWPKNPKFRNGEYSEVQLKAREMRDFIGVFIKEKEIEIEHHVIQSYLFISLVMALRDLGGELSEQAQHNPPAWAGIKWHEKKWYQWIPR